MDLREQKYVCTLAKYGNLTRAAEKLFISQPALSIYITNLEKNIGVPLFDRSGKKFVLTYAGEVYVKKAEQMLILEKEFNDEIYDIVLENVGRIRLGISQGRGSWIIPPAMTEYEKKWTDIDLIIREGDLSDIQEMLKNSELDMVVLDKIDAPDELETELLFEEEFLMAVPARHPINAKAEYIQGERYRRMKPEYLSGETLILHSPWQSSRGIEDVVIKGHNVKPGRVRIIRSGETAVRMAAEGLGIAFIHESYTLNMNNKNTVNYYTIDVEQHRREVVVGYKKSAKLPGYMEEMVNILKEQGKHFLCSVY